MEHGEIWKDVVGFEEYFKVSNRGRIFGKRSGRVLKGSVNSGGYLTINTRFDNRSGETARFLIHRAVAEAFIEEPYDLKYLKDFSHYKIIPVNHKDGDKTNNAVENLEWCSYSDNSRHAVDIGLIVHQKGLENPNFKLNKDQVIYILDHYKPRHREFGARALGRKFGVSHEVVSRAYDFYSDGKL